MGQKLISVPALERVEGRSSKHEMLDSLLEEAEGRGKQAEDQRFVKCRDDKWAAFMVSVQVREFAQLKHLSQH